MRLVRKPREGAGASAPSNRPQHPGNRPEPAPGSRIGQGSAPSRCAYLGKHGLSTPVAVTLESYPFATNNSSGKVCASARLRVCASARLRVCASARLRVCEGVYSHAARINPRLQISSRSNTPHLTPTSRTTQASLPSRRITQSPKANHNAAVAIAIKGKRISSKLTPLPNIRESEFATPEENPIHNANIVTKTPIPTQLQHLSESNSPTALSKHHIRGIRTNLVLKPLGAHEEKTARAK